MSGIILCNLINDNDGLKLYFNKICNIGIFVFDNDWKIIGFC